LLLLTYSGRREAICRQGSKCPSQRCSQQLQWLRRILCHQHQADQGLTRCISPRCTDLQGQGKSIALQYNFSAILNVQCLIVK
jgi:hypothetical protein